MHKDWLSPFDNCIMKKLALKILITLLTTVLFAAVPATAAPDTLTSAEIITKDLWTDVRAFGAKGDGMTDDTAAFNLAIATARAKPTGGTVFVPAGSYCVTSINASSPLADFTKGVTIRGDGVLSTKIIGTGAGKIILDAIGTNYLTLENFTITTKAVAQTGLLLARSSTSQNCSRTKLRNINIEGSFTVAAHVAIAAESSVYESCRFVNTNAAAHYTCFWTGVSNDCGIVSENGNVFESSNTDNKMYSCEFYAPFDNANVIVLSRAAGYSFYSPLVTTGNATDGKLVTYKTKAGENIFNGLPIAWYSPLFEGKNPTSHYLECQKNVNNYFNNISSYDGYYNIYDSGPHDLINYNSGGTTNAILRFSTFTGARFNPLSAPKVTLYAFDSGTLNILSIGLNSKITITGYQGNGELRADAIVEGSSLNYHGESYGTAAPRTGTYAKGHIRWNTDTASMLSIGLMGWQCVYPGTPGSWTPFYRGIASGTTGERPSGAVPIGFSYYDATIGKPVWWNGKKWTLADGSTAP